MNEIELRRYIDRNILEVKRTISVASRGDTVPWTSVTGRPDMTRYLLKAEAAGLYLTRGAGENDGMTRDEISYSYITKSEAWSKAQHESWAGYAPSLDDALSPYQTIAGMSEYLSRMEASWTYLTKTDAASTYMTEAQGDVRYLMLSVAQSDYLTKTEAAGTYLTSSDAAETYLTIDDATSTYATTRWVGDNYMTAGDTDRTFVHKTNTGITDIFDGSTQIGATIEIEGASFDAPVLEHKHIWTDVTDRPTVHDVTLSGDVLTVDGQPVTIINASTVNGRLDAIEADLGTASAVLQAILDGGAS